ncbi:unnamed protein product [Euphydryas editha]|uniref:Apoptosis-resistant E3 ubiquitin protein ligase 1 PH-like domain-containing protein n=1 Tax=Euphydryas editha TaxID=104508 RepID=A0AAU9VEI1_EUPED|nr:unnamed protein product [Euphydryas editha]
MFLPCLGELLSLDVSSLEDVYWLEDTTARHVIDPKDFNAWSAARQSLPTGKEALQSLKSDLWSAVVKSSKHQDAWTWGGMLVVSISVCGLVTLAAMTQPSLAPEAKHSLLQYVTGKYLHPPSCKVEWGWEEPQAVGDTMCFTVFCFQRNGQPYPICDTDELVVNISHGTRKIAAVVELGSGDPAKANTARVKFTVRTAGVYIINILIGGQIGAGGPFRKWFLAGRVEARRSRVGRAHTALVCTAQRARRLHVHPRDRFDNPATLDRPADQVRRATHDTLGCTCSARAACTCTRATASTTPPRSTAPPTRCAALHTTHSGARAARAPPARAPARPLRQPRHARPPRRPGAPRYTRHTRVHVQRARRLHVHPRDRFDNPATLDRPADQVRRATHDTLGCTCSARAVCTCTRATASTTPPRSTAPPTRCAALHTTHSGARAARAPPARAPARPLRQPRHARPPRRPGAPRYTRHTRVHVQRARRLHVHPRDRFDNPATLDRPADQVRRATHDTLGCTCSARAACTCTRATASTTPPRSTAPPTRCAALHTTHSGARAARAPSARAPARPLRQPRHARPPRRPGAPRYTRHTRVHVQRARRLHVHPRDRFDNPATLDRPADQGFSIELGPLGGAPEPELGAAASFEYDAVNQRVSVTLCFPSPGVFRAAIYYERVLLHNGEFDCIVLTASDTASVQRQLSARRGAAFEARLVGGRARRVLCCLSAKQLLVKDYILRFIPKRITSFRLCPSTRLQLAARAGAGPGGELTLDDGVQPALRLWSAERDLLAAAFTQLLLANCGGEDGFKVSGRPSLLRLG